MQYIELPIVAKIIINREILRDIRIFLIGETVRILVSNPKIFEFDS